MLCELNTCVYVWLTFFESYVVRLNLNDQVVSTFVADIVHAFAKPTNYVFAYVQEIYQSAICNVHRMGQLDQLLHCVLQIISPLFAHYENNLVFYIYKLIA